MKNHISQKKKRNTYTISTSKKKKQKRSKVSSPALKNVLLLFSLALPVS